MSEGLKACCQTRRKALLSQIFLLRNFMPFSQKKSHAHGTVVGQQVYDVNNTMTI